MYLDQPKTPQQVEAEQLAMFLADELIDALKIMYASQFRTNFNEMSVQAIRNLFAKAMIGISQPEFNKGMARLMSGQNQFMPNVSEFKSWCVSGAWWSSSEAWYHACEASNDAKHRITEITKECWDSVYHIVLNGDMKEAKHTFKNLYEERVTRAQLQGVRQKAYEPPKALEVKVADPKYNALNQLDPVKTKEVQELIQAYMAEGLSLYQAGIRACKERTA